MPDEFSVGAGLVVAVVEAAGVGDREVVGVTVR